MKAVLAFLALIVLVLVLTVNASAHNTQWWHHTLPNNKVTCNKSNTTPNAADAGPFASKALCLAFVADPGGGTDNGGDTPLVVAPNNTPEGIWLCYSPLQTAPGAWPKDQAATLISSFGYWEASGVLGNVDGAANVGGYHLACNTGLAPTGEFVGAGGEVYGRDYNSDANHTATEQTGFYPIVG